MTETEKPRYKAWCKATRRESAEPRYSHNWVTARRGWFRIFADRIECGGWKIEFSSIERAIVYRTRQMWIPVSVLHLITADGSYQFGFNPWARPLKYLDVLTPEEESVRLKYSPFSVAVRLLAFAFLVYWFWSRYIRT